MDRFARVSWLEDNFVLDLIFYPVKLLTYDVDGLVGVIVLLNYFVNRLVSINRYFEGRGYNLLSAMIKCYGCLGVGLLTSFLVGLGSLKVQVLVETQNCLDRKSTRLNSSHAIGSRMPSSA